MARTYNHPLKHARTKYSRHKAQSKYRNIPFLFTFEDWYAWWLSNGVDKNVDTFDKSDRDRLCMCRYNDTGAYEASNVYCATMVQNALDKPDPVGRPQYPIYRWGDQRVTLDELRKLTDNPTPTAAHWRHDVYDRARAIESRQLTNRFRETYGSKRTRTEYLWDGEWYKTLNSVSAAAGMDPGTYKKRLALGQEGYESRLTHKLEDYILAHTRYPDPIIPRDV